MEGGSAYCQLCPEYARGAVLPAQPGGAAYTPATRRSRRKQMEFLRGALAEVCKGQMDEVEQMKQCLEVLSRDECRGRGSEEEEKDEREEVLEMLSELCENLDNARDLMKLGGLDLCMSRCLCHSEAGIRWRAAQLIASCAQNMPEVQFYLLNQGALLTLLQLADHDANSTVRIKALYDLCLVREQEAGLRDFLSHDGFSVLMRGMQSDSEKLRTKSAFLLLNLLTSHPEHKGNTVLSMGMVQQLVSVLRSPHSSVHEHVLGALCGLVEDSPRGVNDCRDASLGLEELLNQRVQDLRGREESLVKLLF
uniref:Hsp70-binding protein 1 n=1 Tax=Sinocyclocheilus grahami TaxID=75366 RepID=A0A672PSA7_SINGR